MIDDLRLMIEKCALQSSIGDDFMLTAPRIANVRAFAEMQRIAEVTPMPIERTGACLTRM